MKFKNRYDWVKLVFHCLQNRTRFVNETLFLLWDTYLSIYEWQDVEKKRINSPKSESGNSYQTQKETAWKKKKRIRTWAREILGL